MYIKILVIMIFMNYEILVFISFLKFEKNLNLDNIFK